MHYHLTVWIFDWWRLSIKTKTYWNKNSWVFSISSDYYLSCKKDDKVNKTSKYHKDLYYDTAKNFDKRFCLILIKLHQLTLNLIYETNFMMILKGLKGVKSEKEDTKQEKIKVLKDASLLYHEVISIYKKNMIKFLKARIKRGG